MDDTVGDKASFNVERAELEPATKLKNALFHTAPFILGNEMCERLAYYGMSTNLVVYLTTQLGYGAGSATSMMQIWQGTCYLTPLAGAYLADAKLGRFKVIAVFSTIYLLGMALLTLTTMVPGIRPPGDGSPASGVALVAFWASMYIIALGTGGIKPNVSAFGADQFNPDDPREAKYISTFFSYFYMAINVGSLLASTVVVWIQDEISWTLGFAVPAIAMAVAIVVFFVASGRYIKRPPAGNPYRDMFSTLKCAASKRGLPLPDTPEELHEVSDDVYRDKMIHRMPHTERQRWLDHAAIQGPGLDMDKDKVKTVTEVEEVKQLGGLLPIAAVAIVYQCLYAQMFSLFVLQGSSMNTSGAPSAGQMTTADIITVLVGMPLYDRVLEPLLKKVCKWNSVKRIGVGYVIAAVAILIGGLVEMVRLGQVNALGLQDVDPTVAPPPLSIWWQVPQYVAIGLSEVFAMSGMYAFFYAEAPDSLVSFSMAIQLLTVAAGSYLSSLLVFIIGLVTCCPGWMPPASYKGGINVGHVDYFFYLLFGMQLAALGVHVVLAKRYCSKRVIEWPTDVDAPTGGDEPGEGEPRVEGTVRSKYSFAIGSETARKRLGTLSQLSQRGGGGDDEERVPMM